jgi:EAL domain-containing protein (putative c-di-GMP-specific phosphodiesterase class I)
LNLIVTLVRNAIEMSGLPPEALAVQFTERVVAVNYDRFIVALSELKKMNVSVILDNVGSYYTATSLLRHSGISAVKADFTLFTGIVDEFSEVYINNLLELARKNNVSVGVKSVDSAGQLEMLTGADWYQGAIGSGFMEEEEFLMSDF